MSHPAKSCRSYALNLVQLGAMRDLVRDAQPQDSFFVYCAFLGLDDSTYMYQWCFELTHLVVSGHGVQIDDLDGDEPDGKDECPSTCILSGMPVTNRMLLGICAVDYLGNPYLNANTPGLIVDDVSCLEQQRICSRSIPFSLQIMHKILVKSLPPQCHLTAIYDVRTINNVL